MWHHSGQPFGDLQTILMPLSNSHGLISSLRHMSAAWHLAPALDASLTHILAPGVHGWTVLFELGFKFGLYGGQTSSIHHLLSQASLASFTSHSFHLLNILNQPYLLSEMPRCCNSDLLSYPLDSLHKNFSLLLQTLLRHHLRCLSLHLHLQSHPIPLLILINIKGRPWLVEGKQKHEALESLSDRQSRKDQEISAAQKGTPKPVPCFNGRRSRDTTCMSRLTASRYQASGMITQPASVSTMAT